MNKPPGTTGDRTTLEMLHFARENGIPSVDISVNEGLGVYNNLPHNGHPSALANKEYADKLEAFLRAEILKNENYMGKSRAQRYGVFLTCTH
jgi:hypothetical protein